MRKIASKAWNSPSLTTWASLGLRAGGAVVILPLLLKSLQPAEVTVWYLLASIGAYASLLDLGFGHTTSRAVSYALLGRHLPLPGDPTPVAMTSDHDRAVLLGNIIKATKTIYVWIAGAALFLLLTVGIWAFKGPIGQLAHPSDGYLALGLYIIGTPFLIFNVALLALLQGAGRVALVRRWDSIFLVATIGCTALVLLSGGRLFALCINAQFWSVAGLVRSYYLFKGFFPKRAYDESSAGAVPATLRRLWPAAWKFGSGTILYSGTLQASGFIYAQYGESKGVASYLVASQILNLLKQTSQAPFQSRLPVLASLSAADSVGPMVALAKRAAGLSYWAFVIPFVALEWLAPKALLIIGSKTPFVTPLMWGLMGAGALIERLGGTHQQLIAVSNRVEAHIAGLGFAIIYFVALPFLARPYGAYAFPLAILAGHLAFFTPYSLVKSYRLYGLNASTFDTVSFGVPLIVLVVSILSYISVSMMGLIKA